MDFEWLESLLYGFIIGLAEILPVSASAHRAMLLKLFGSKNEGPFLSLMIHIAIFIAIYMNYRIQLKHMQRQLKLAQVPRYRRRREPDMQKVLDLRLIKTGAVPVLLSFAAYSYVSPWRSNLGVIAAVLLFNGLILYVPQFLPGGNKDSRTMSRLDSIIIGLFGALGIIPGISRMGAMTSVAVARGADRSQALYWALLLTMPVMIVLCGIDVFQLFATGMSGVSFGGIVIGIFTAIAAYAGTTCAMIIMRALAVSTSYGGFAYYSWGAALFSLILYLTT